MFTGIIKKIGTVSKIIEQTEGHLSIEIETGFLDLSLGESVAVNGVCLTVEHLLQSQATFFISPETLDKTNLRALRLGSSLNLERALSLNDRLSGHWVQGHVDAQSELLDFHSHEKTWFMKFSLNPSLLCYCVKKGSITVNGVSLTVNHIQLSKENIHAEQNIHGQTYPQTHPSYFEVALIPHTWAHTNLSQLSRGDFVNIEVDILAKYVESLLAHPDKNPERYNDAFNRS